MIVVRNTAHEVLCEIHSKQDLQRQNQRNAQGKFAVPCFVAEQIHSQKNTHTAAQGGKEKQGCFRDSPKVFLCPGLVRKHSTADAALIRIR